MLLNLPCGELYTETMTHGTIKQCTVNLHENRGNYNMYCISYSGIINRTRNGKLLTWDDKLLKF